jgi:hypothetical protein
MGRDGERYALIFTSDKAEYFLWGLGIISDNRNYLAPTLPELRRAQPSGRFVAGKRSDDTCAAIRGCGCDSVGLAGIVQN